MGKRKKSVTLENLLIDSYAAEGKCIAKHEGKIIFIEGVVPGDVVNVLLTKNKNDWAEARVLQFVSYGSNRVQPFCKHFGAQGSGCGGCKWQMLPYELQTQYKAQQVKDVITRIGKITNAKFLPIAACSEQSAYRNKLEFTFSNKRYLATHELNTEIANTQDVLGFHAPRLFDKVINIEHCHLQAEPSNAIRNALREFAYREQLSFYDIRAHKGLLRNLIIRSTSTGQWMINMVFGENDPEQINKVLQFLNDQFPDLNSLYYTVNLKHNDTLYDQDVILYKGEAYIEEKLEDFKFKISPKSFFQTNTKQAELLYRIARDFAQLQGHETLYDLYCGTGSIGIFMSRKAGKIIGVESVPDAIEDAKINALANGLNNTQFYAGDVIKVCNEAFFNQHGFPDVIITDPPRAGMHADLIELLLKVQSPRIVYISCNPATQARDLYLLSKAYNVLKVQAVDMFPHTHHVESVALLELK